MPRSCGSSIVRISLLILAAARWNAHAQSIPNLILANGRVFTSVDSRLYAQAIAIKGSRIIAVGSNQEILAMAGPKTRRIDVGGRVVIPGINDAHVHFDEDPIATTVDFGNSDPTCAGMLARLGQAARSVTRGTLLVGT
jgi:predicted amidohydrolase YtcJ